MRYLVSQVEQWGAEIDAMPAPDPGRRKVGKKEAIVLLARKLQAAARRGFSTAELHEALSAMGLKVHVDTLRSALRDAGQRPSKQPARARRSRGVLERRRPESRREGERADGRDPHGITGDKATARAAANEPRNGPEVVTGRTPAAITKVDRSHLGMTQAVRPGPRPASIDRATFIPREDSDEL
jgi:hypothetical protein